MINKSHESELIKQTDKKYHKTETMNDKIIIIIIIMV